MHDNATASLRNVIRPESPADFLKLLEFLRELRADAYLLANMLTNDFDVDEHGRSSIRRWHSIYRIEKLPIWRLRSLELEAVGVNYRIIYLYYWRERTYYVIDIVHKSKLTSSDYDDPQNPIRKRLVSIVRNEFPDA
ncbi:MAG: hypothetical protein JNL55_16740 [Steroidobacter sp.]|nr:hypothetical protein [Steroidobacter sp.]